MGLAVLACVVGGWIALLSVYVAMCGASALGRLCRWVGVCRLGCLAYGALVVWSIWGCKLVEAHSSMLGTSC